MHRNTKAILYTGLFSLTASLSHAQEVVNDVPKETKENTKKTISSANYDVLSDYRLKRELFKLGFDAGSFRLNHETPSSTVMKVYLITDGKAKLVQTSKPTPKSTSYDIGYLIRPTKDGTSTASLIYCNHDYDLTKGMGSEWPNIEAKPYPLPSLNSNSPKLHTRSLMGLGSANIKAESVIFYATEKIIGEITGSLEEKAAKIANGYMITSTLNFDKE